MESPIKKFECLNCKALLSIPINEDETKLKCCSSPKLKALLIEQKEDFTQLLGKCYEEMVYLHEYYLDWDINEIKIQCIWNIFTYFYKSFNTAPYRFVTAMKGSGKTRLLNLTKALAYNPILTVGMSDSSLFRSAADHTLLFDEAESIGKKEKQAQREILNSGYKKGSSVIRIEEEKKDGKKGYVNKEFDTFSPKMLCNIWGMEEVLADRCIPSILEKSNNPAKVKLQEDFDKLDIIKQIKRTLNNLVQFGAGEQAFPEVTIWNNFIKNKYTTYTTLHNYTILHPTTPTIEQEEMFNKIDASGLEGRALELFFPLFTVARWISMDTLEELIEIAKNKNKNRKESDFYESKDIAVYDFISQLESTLEFISVKDLTQAFKNFYQDDSDEREWLNPHWFGKAIKRLKLDIKTRRMGRGVEIIPNVTKAKEKIKIFREVSKDKEGENE